MDKQFKKFSKKLKDEFEYAASVALNDAAFEVRTDLGKHTDEVFDGGATKFTQNAFAVSKKAKKTDLSADVQTKDIQSNYLANAIEGGTRSKGDYATSKTVGIVVPGSAARTNQFGNLARGYLRKQTARKDTFMGRAMINGSSELGVFKRKKMAGSKSKTKLQVLALFKEKTVHKKSTFDLIGTAAKTFNAVMIKSMKEAVRDLKTHGKVRSSFARRKDN